MPLKFAALVPFYHLNFLLLSFPLIKVNRRAIISSVVQQVLYDVCARNEEVEEEKRKCGSRAFDASSKSVNIIIIIFK